MKKTVKMAVSVLALGCIGLVAGGGLLHRAESLEAGPVAPARHPVDELLERHIPFQVDALPLGAAAADCFQMDVVVHLDERGRELDYTWRAMDGEDVLVECKDFYDLYYRCDAPGMIRARIITMDQNQRRVATRSGLFAVR